MSKHKPTKGKPHDFKRAVAAFQAGDPVLIHDADDREGETDIVYPASAVTPEVVTRLRNDAGGLVCVAISHEVAEELDLSFLQEIIDHPVAGEHELGYDDRSSFSLPVNHRETYTGITDSDRSLTIRKLAELAAVPDEGTFSDEFRSPGHVHVLKAAPNLLQDRQGHTELGIALAEHAGLPPAVVVCEMLDDETGHELSREKAKRYADTNGFCLLEGQAIINEVEPDPLPEDVDWTPVPFWV